ncbi:tetratricopeptide repeat protein [Chitinimonas arctica]|uniref:Tetratricopeptide repeat protein n=1 Tax=Chitinimonas arctica TaxID=2594795 RepID=A0A516SLJ1_9NEIS|nr:tetratricopeptide repeat protein [Chitinimonas arctica]QDQ29026.1 tetratricopeptide repeat protein [Chitinimonas arctica]
MTFSFRPLLGLLALAGCATSPITGQGDVYSMQREADAAYRSGDDSQGERLLQGVLRLAPNDAESWFRLGNLYARSDRPEQALDAYQRCLMLQPGDSRAWHNLGVVRLRQTSAALAQAHALAGDDEALRGKTARMLELLQQAQKADKP